MPAREAKRRLVLEYVAQRFEPDREYDEQQVNGVLLELFDDYVTLRRFLVDEGRRRFLARSERGDVLGYGYIAPSGPMRVCTGRNHKSLQAMNSASSRRVAS